MMGESKRAKELHFPHLLPVTDPSFTTVNIRHLANGQRIWL